jgi:two-component system NtrC family sensor kinase
VLHVRGIATKVAVAVAVTVIVGFALLALALHQTASQYIHDQARRQALRLADSVWLSAHAAMADNQHDRIRETLRAVVEQSDIERVLIVNHSGVVGYSSNRDDEGLTRRLEEPGCKNCHTEQSVPVGPPPWSYEVDHTTLGLVRPLYNLPDCQHSGCHAPDAGAGVLGVLLMNVSVDRQEAQVASLGRQLFVSATLLTLLVTAVVFGLLKRLVGRPVGELVDGTRRLASGDLSQPIPVRSHDEIGELALSFNENTEELARVQRQLTEMEKLASVGRLAAGVAHEINNPLTGILTYAETLRDDVDPSQQADIDAIIAETLRCREIVRRLLGFARRRPPTKRPTDLNEIVERVVHSLERQKTFASTILRTQPARGLPTAMLDGNQIHQVLANLLLNAAQAMPEGGIVTVTTETSDDRKTVYLHVSDTGTGVPPEVRPHIFDPFFTTKSSGTGLGLPVVWGIVQQHRGRLSFVTESGHGTTFSVELPVTPETAERHDSFAPAASRRPTETPRGST